MRYTHADPTANQAIANITREERRLERLRQAEERRLRAKPQPIAQQPSLPNADPDHPVWQLVWTDKTGRISR